MNNWTIKNNQLNKDFSFPDFSAAMDFINHIAAIAEEQDHHPDIFLHDYNQVSVSISTHEAGKITDQDHHLAELIDKI